jgi:hypothetical protein
MLAFAVAACSPASPPAPAPPPPATVLWPVPWPAASAEDPATFRAPRSTCVVETNAGCPDTARCVSRVGIATGTVYRFTECVTGADE